MKQLLFLCIFLLASCGHAQNKEELINDIFEEVMASHEEIKGLPELFDETREALIETFKPKGREIKDPELLVMQEQLYLDVKASDMYQGYMEGLKEAFAEDLDEEFSYQELVKLKSLLTDPLLTRLENIRMNNLSAGEDFTENWTKKNEALVNVFLERQKEINAKLKANLMKSSKSENN